MTIEKTKEQLICLLQDRDYKVIVLKGRWGTGKSHLWKEVQRSSTDNVVKDAIYVSLFGLKDINDIKHRLLQNAIPKLNANPAIAKSVTEIIRGAQKVLSSINKGFSILEDLASLGLPTMLNGKLVVIDDIERKHEQLSTDQVLGFIDEFTQQHNVRFLLILNSDQLKQKETWDTLHEKVVDHEITLTTSSDEAFGIAVQLTPSPYAKEVKQAIDTCGVTNIRVIRKVLKSVNKILDGHNPLDLAVLSRVIPSIVVLTAIHFKGIENGPDFTFVLSQGRTSDPFGEDGEGKAEVKKKKGATKQEGEWKLMLQELGIYATDEMELLIVEFLKSGMFDVSSLSAILQRYTQETDTMKARERLKEFHHRLVWDHRASDAALLEEAKSMVGIAYLLDPYHLTEIVSSMERNLPGSEAIAKDMIASWIEQFKKHEGKGFEGDDVFGRKLHPLLSAEFQAADAKEKSNTSVVEACEHIIKNRGWGDRQEHAMRSASVSDFETIIRTLEIERLQPFLRRMIEFKRQKAYHEHFGSAMDHFSKACRNIVLDKDAGKLSRLIKRVFEDAGYAENVSEPEKPVPPKL